MKKVIVESRSSYREKGSKFIGYLFEATSVNEFENKLENIKSEYPDATHHCYGWRIGPANLKEFAQDDGEPGGTAGLPILNQLKSFDVVNSGCVVVRYYGGTNLGKSGLIDAYGHSAERCLQKADLQPIQLIWKLCLNYPYAEQNAIEQLVHQFDLKELESTYTEEVRLMLGCPVEHKTELENRLNQLAHRNIEARFLEESYL